MQSSGKSCSSELLMLLPFSLCAHITAIQTMLSTCAPLHVTRFLATTKHFPIINRRVVTVQPIIALVKVRLLHESYFVPLWGLLRLWFQEYPMWHVHPCQHGVVEGPTRLYHLRSEQSFCVWQMQHLFGKWDHRHDHLHDDLVYIQPYLRCHWGSVWIVVC